MGVSLPNWVNPELALWTNAIQQLDGGGLYYPRGAPGYPNGYRYGGMNETGALLLLQKYLGLPTGNASVQAALNFLDVNWLIGLGGASGFEGNFGHPYAMWPCTKGSRWRLVWII